MSLARLIKKRKRWVDSSQENNFDFDSILSGLYNDPSHFIYEILQNAEDASAKAVRFELFNDRLDIHHDGRDFDFGDIEGVTGIGISTKRDDVTAIGKFGVGFKSVFAVTEAPYISSGEYNIGIEDFVVPVEMTTDNRRVGTLIRLPFNHKFRPKEAVYDLVSKKLENIGLKTLLFLRNIEEIKWSSTHGKGHYVKETKDLGGAKRVTAISEKDSEEYIVIEKPIKMDGMSLKVEVAYKLGTDKQGKEILVQEPDSKLVVYFPTEKVTFLNFLVQGPYKTTPNRENIPLDDEQNKMIIEETGKLIAESLPVIKRLGFLNTNFLNLMPINPEHREKEPIYSVLYDKVKGKFLSDEELLPTHDRRYSRTSDALLVGRKDLAVLLDREDIELLFSKRNWLATDITSTSDDTRELHKYLKKELGIKEIDFEDFAKNITEDFLRTKSDEWMIDFYSRLLDQEALWRDRGYKAGILRTMPIIRLDNDEHIEPFDREGKPQVYLPSEKRSEFKTVKRKLIENENALKFLKELGLSKPDLFAEVKEFVLPKFHSGEFQINEDYYEAFEKLLNVYESISLNKKKDYVTQLKDTPFICSINRTNQERIHKPTDIYFSGDGLKEYFADNDEIFFVSGDLVNKFGVERLTPFLQEIGVADSPRRIQVEGKLSWEEKSRLRGNTGYTRDIHQKDFDYEGLTIFLDGITPEKSVLLWSLLLRGMKGLDSSTARNYFKGEYKWFYYADHPASFDATFLKRLKQERWLVNREGKMFKPLEVTVSELSDEYIKESPNVEILISGLSFKPAIIDQLPPEDKKKYELTKGYTLSALEKIISEHEKKSGTKKTAERNEKEWKPDHKPDEIDVEIEEAIPTEIIISGLEGQSETLKTATGEESCSNQTSKEESYAEDTESLSTSDKMKIGTHGENLVFNELRKKYLRINGNLIATDFGFKLHDPNGNEIEIVWLNKNNVGKGCDFVRKENGTEVEYIEVKTKLGSHEELIEITGTQWEFARMLYNRGEGYKYSIYVVSNANQLNPKITKLNNPIGLWKEGKLYAHPVKFRL